MLESPGVRKRISQLHQYASYLKNKLKIDNSQSQFAEHYNRSIWNNIALKNQEIRNDSKKSESITTDRRISLERQVNPQFLQKIKDVKNKNLELKNRCQKLQKQVEQKSKIYRHTVHKNFSYSQRPQPFFMKVFMTRLKITEPLNKIYKTIFDQSSQQFSNHCIYFTNKQTDSKTNLKENKQIQSQIIFVNPDTFSIHKQSIKLIDIDSFERYDKLIKFKGKNNLVLNNKAEQVLINYYLFVQKDAQSWSNFLKETAKTLQSQNLSPDLKWKKTKVKITNEAISVIHQSDQLSMISVENAFTDNKKNNQKEKAAYTNTSARKFKGLFKNFQENSSGYFKQKGLRKHSQEQSMHNNYRSSVTYPINSQFQELSEINKNQQIQTPIQIQKIQPFNIISTPITDSPNKIDKMKEKQEELKKSATKKHTIYWLQETHNKPYHNYEQINEDISQSLYSQKNRKETSRPPKLHLKNYEKSFSMQNSSKVFSESSKKQQIHTESIKQGQNSIKDEEQIIINIIQKEREESQTTIKEKMDKKMGKIYQKSVYHSHRDYSETSSSPSKKKMKSQLKLIARKQSQRMKNDHRRNSNAKKIEEQQIQEQKEEAQRNSYKSSISKKEDHKKRITNHSKDKSSKKGLLHKFESFQTSSEEEDQQSFSSSDEGEEWMLSMQMLKNGIVLWKYSNDGWSGHEKKLFIDRNESVVCYCDINNKLDEKKIFFRDIKAINYGSIGKGIIKHKGANVERNRCLLIHYTSNDKEKVWEFMLSSTQQIYNLVQFSRKLQQLWEWKGQHSQSG